MPNSANQTLELIRRAIDRDRGELINMRTVVSANGTTGKDTLSGL
jgi:hypothetical protein